MIVKNGLIYKKWIADQTDALVLLVHGMGAHFDRWQDLALFLKSNNLSSFGLDLRGFGQTPGLRGHVDSFKIYYEDIKKLRKIMQNEHPGKKIFILGESMGAVISFSLCLQCKELFDGIICVSPAFKSVLKFNPLVLAFIYLCLLIYPRKQFLIPFSSSMCTQDVEYLEKMDQDQREHRLATSRLLFNLVLAQTKSILFKNKLKISTLFLVAANDSIVSTPMSEKIFQGLSIKDKEIKKYPDMYHALTIDINRKCVFEDIKNWMKKHL
ncbi:MAG: lysophospholipase [Candidatus Omnitrophota bacterium]